MIFQYYYRWLESVDERPGFNTQVLDGLKKLHAQNPDQYTSCSLLIDAMAIKLQVDYDQKFDRMVGFVDLGQGEGDDDGTEEAKEALVFMVVGLTGNWKVPIAYFFTRTLNAKAQHQLLLHALDHLHNVGLRIHVVTMDGHATNVKMCRLLGCEFDNAYQMKTSFEDPHSKNNIFVVFDACHMLKLVRNMLDAFKIITSLDGKISWQFIKDLQTVQVNIPNNILR